MDRFVYKKEKTREISFPLGGIGTGCVGLAAIIFIILLLTISSWDMVQL